MYESDDYDNEKFTHSLFGDHSFRDNREFGDFKAANNLPYDCFWDGADDLDLVENFVQDNTDLGIAVYSNDVIAIMPNGTMIRFDFLTDGDFEDWAHSMYQLAYPN
ncbi:MAG: hypothetical protein KAS62_12765, partial [Candidatus Delongbacteria bacterium]|nr:hypothetical protein [Candidatus Delongbacteria bacterium]